MEFKKFQEFITIKQALGKENQMPKNNKQTENDNSLKKEKRNRERGGVTRNDRRKISNIKSQINQSKNKEDPESLFSDIQKSSANLRDLITAQPDSTTCQPEELPEWVTDAVYTQAENEALINQTVDDEEQRHFDQVLQAQSAKPLTLNELLIQIDSSQFCSETLVKLKSIFETLHPNLKEEFLNLIKVYPQEEVNTKLECLHVMLEETMDEKTTLSKNLTQKETYILNLEKINLSLERQLS